MEIQPLSYFQDDYGLKSNRADDFDDDEDEEEEEEEEEDEDVGEV